LQHLTISSSVQQLRQRDNYAADAGHTERLVNLENEITLIIVSDVSECDASHDVMLISVI
jgi:hypothetical protein